MSSKLKKALKHPSHAIRVAKSIGLGYWYKAWYKICRKNVHIGKNFKVYGRLSIKGPGKVVIGDNCRVGMVVTPWTFSKRATISIGDNTFLNGTRFACEDKITIGKDCIFADCRIMDTDFHGVTPGKRFMYKNAPVKIHNDVWVTIGAIILKGVTIHSGSTITPNSVVSEDVPSTCVYGGNPGKVIKKLT